MALTWTSSDLAAWTYDGSRPRASTAERDPVWMGALWECPQVFEVDGHGVMLASVWEADVLHHVGYGLGATFDRGRFAATDWGRLGFGDSYYAPSYFRDREGRPCLIFWMRGVADAEAGWSGCLSMPYVLSIEGGRLVADPTPRSPTAGGAVAGWRPELRLRPRVAARPLGGRTVPEVPDRDDRTGRCPVRAPRARARR